MAERESSEIVVQAPPAAVMEIITDFEAYPDWAESIQDVEVLETDGEGRATKVWYHVDARVMDVEYTLAYHYEENRLTWTLDEADQLRALDGEYLLTPEGEGTRVRYTVEIDPAFPIPGFLKKRAAKQILETSLGDLKQRVEAVGR